MCVSVCERHPPAAGEPPTARPLLCFPRRELPDGGARPSVAQFKQLVVSALRELHGEVGRALRELHGEGGRGRSRGRAAFPRPAAWGWVRESRAGAGGPPLPPAVGFEAAGGSLGPAGREQPLRLDLTLPRAVTGLGGCAFRLSGCSVPASGIGGTDGGCGEALEAELWEGNSFSAGEAHRAVLAVFTVLLGDFGQAASPLGPCFPSCNVELEVASVCRAPRGRVLCEI